MREAMEIQDRIDLHAKRVAVGDRLAPLLDDDVSDYLDGVESSLIAAMIDAPAMDDDARRGLAITVKTLRNLRRFIDGVVGNRQTHENEMKRLIEKVSNDE